MESSKTGVISAGMTNSFLPTSTITFARTAWRYLLSLSSGKVADLFLNVLSRAIECRRLSIRQCTKKQDRKYTSNAQSLSMTAGAAVNAVVKSMLTAGKEH